MQAQDIQKMIAAGMPQAHVQVTGEDGAHFAALVVNQDFAGKATLARHRLVYATLGQAMGFDIHALSLRTLTPEEQHVSENAVKNSINSAEQRLG